MSNKASDHLAQVQSAFAIIYVVIYGVGFIAVIIYAYYVELYGKEHLEALKQQIDEEQKEMESKEEEKEKEEEEETSNHDEKEDDIIDALHDIEKNKKINRNKNKNKKWYSKLYSRFNKYKSIYMTSIIHFSDVITDYLVLCQYIIFAIDEIYYNENYANINYLAVSIAACLTIVFNKILSSYYIWIFTENIWDIILNILDFYIFKEIFASHKSGNKTDLMQFLQKVEKIFESSPQFLIQMFVLLRTNATADGLTTITQFASILLSMYAISDKLISDDKKLFIQETGANSLWKPGKPNKQFLYRILFRICEVISNMFVLIIIAVFYGSYILLLYVLWLLLINYILFSNGLLGEDKSNIISYIVAVMNLGITPKGNAHQTKTKCISNILQKIISCLYKKSICLQCKSQDKYKRFLSYYYITSRIIQGICIVIITIILFYAANDIDCIAICPNKETRHAQELQLQIFLFICLACYILEYIFYLSMFDSMNLGISLLRDTKTLLTKHQFADAFRLQRIKKPKKSESRIFDKILNLIINENVPLLLIHANQTAKNDINEDIKKEHLYLIDEINNFTSSNQMESQKLLCTVLQKAIFYCHSSLIDLVIKNKWIDNLVDVKFTEKADKNLLSLLIEHCNHRIDILESICIDNDKYIENFTQLLKAETGTNTRYGTKEYVIHQLLVNNLHFGPIVKNLSTKYWAVFVQCGVLRYILEYGLSTIAKFVQMQITDNFKALDEAVQQLHDRKEANDRWDWKISVVQIATLLRILKNHKKHGANLSKISKYKSSRKRYEWYKKVLMSGDYNLFCDFLDLVADMKAELYYYWDSGPRQNSCKEYKQEKTSYLGLFIRHYSSIKNIEWAKYILLSFDIDVHEVIREVSESDTTVSYDRCDEYEITSLQLAVREGYVDVVKLMLNKGNIDPSTDTVQTKAAKWRDLESKPSKLIDFATTEEMTEALAEYVYENMDENIEKEEKVDPNEMDDDEEVNAKSVYETMLINAFYENNPVLFDILIETWNINNPKDIINVFNFQDEANLLQLISNEHGHAQNERNLSLWFAVFEKHYYQTPDATDKSGYKEILINNMNAANYSFVYKLSGLSYIKEISENSKYEKIVPLWFKVWSGNTSSGGILDVAIKMNNGVAFIDRILALCGNASSVTAGFPDDDEYRGRHRVEDFIVDVIKLPEPCKYLDLLCGKHQLKVDQWPSQEMIKSKNGINIMRILEFKYKYIDNKMRNTIFTQCISLNSIQFLRQWFFVLEGKKIKASELISANHEVIISSVNSNVMIQFLIKNGWRMISFDEAINKYLREIGPVLLQYIVDTENLKVNMNKVQLNHLNDAMECMKRSNEICVFNHGDNLHILLLLCDKQLQSEFAEKAKMIQIDDNNKQLPPKTVNWLLIHMNILEDDQKIDQQDDENRDLRQNKKHFFDYWTNKNAKVYKNSVLSKAIDKKQQKQESYDLEKELDAYLEETCTLFEEQYGKKQYEIPINRVETSLLNLYQRYSLSALVNDLICNSHYFCNKKYEYYIESEIVGIIRSKPKGIYLFHAILKDNNISDLFQLIMKNKANNTHQVDIEIKVDDEDGIEENVLLLLLDKNKQLPIECVVYGSYNEQYQKMKFNHSNQSQLDFINLLHKMQYDTIDIKLTNIL